MVCGDLEFSFSGEPTDGGIEVVVLEPCEAGEGGSSGFAPDVEGAPDHACVFADAGDEVGVAEAVAVLGVVDLVFSGEPADGGVEVLVMEGGDVFEFGFGELSVGVEGVPDGPRVCAVGCHEGGHRFSKGHKRGRE